MPEKKPLKDKKLSASDWIRQQPLSMPPRDVMAKAQKAGLTFSSGLVSIVRSRMEGHKPRKRGKPSKAVGDVLFHLDKKLLREVVSSVNADRLVREASKAVKRMLQNTGISHIAISLVDGKTTVIQRGSKVVSF